MSENENEKNHHNILGLSIDAVISPGCLFGGGPRNPESTHIAMQTLYSSHAEHVPHAWQTWAGTAPLKFGGIFETQFNTP